VAKATKSVKQLLKGVEAMAIRFRAFDGDALVTKELIFAAVPVVHRFTRSVAFGEVINEHSSVLDVKSRRDFGSKVTIQRKMASLRACSQRRQLRRAARA
jgi:hypothetical protein